MGRRTVTGSTLADSVGPSSLPVSSIAHNPRNPRLPEDYEWVDELAESIRTVGLLQPLAVTRYELFLTQYPEHEQAVGSHDWVVLDGNRRLAALRLAGLPDAAVHVVDRLGRDGMIDEAAIIANVHHESLPPMREAQALRLLVERHGSQAEVARRIKKTKGFVSQRLTLLDLPADKQAAVEAGTLSIAQARSAASAAAASEQNAASDYGVNGRASRVGRPRQPRDPAKVVAKLRRDLTEDELAAVVRLLTTDP